MKRALIFIMLLSFISLIAAKITVVESSENYLILDFVLDDYQVLAQGDYSLIQIDEASFPATPGMPSLPELEFKIGIPPNGASSYTLLSSTQKPVTLPSRLLPIPHIYKVDGVAEYDYAVDEKLYNEAPSHFIHPLATHIFRDQPFIPYILYPFIYDGNLQLTVIQSARIRIDITGNTSAKNPARNDPMAMPILNQMLNSDYARYWTMPKRTQINYADFSRSPWWIRIETDKDGLYRINPGQLSGFDLDQIDPRSFRLFSTFGKVLPLDPLYAGEEFTEIPIKVIGEEDGSFDSSDYILFYGSDRDGYEVNSVLNDSSSKIYYNPYSKRVVYWLTHAGDFDNPPLRITMDEPLIDFNNDVDYHREKVHIETETHRRELIGYDWYLTRMFGSSTLDYTFDINLPDLDPSESQLLEFRMRQEDVSSELTHSITVFVNGEIIPNSATENNNHTWYSTFFLNFAETTSAFHSGNNSIVIRVNRGTTRDNLFLDFYRVTYSRNLIKTNTQFMANAYLSTNGQGVKYNFSGSASELTILKVTDFSSISQVPFIETATGFYFTATGGSTTRFVVAKPGEFYSPASLQSYDPVDLVTMTSPIQSVIVSPAEFLDQAQILSDLYQQNWGYHTKVVLQDDIFDQFSGGHPDPGAIRQYMRYIYHNAPEPSLQTLTLLGLGTLDWRNFSTVAAIKNKIIIYQDPYSSVTSDDYFAMLTNSNYPEIAVGRYPVINENELNNMINNFRNYTQNSPQGLWRNSVVFLADDEVNGSNTNEWIHTQDMQSLSNMINPSVLNSKIFAAQYDSDEFHNKPKVRDALFDEINNGKLMFYYVGHGSFDILGMQDYLNVSTDLGRFQNHNMLPLFIASSCEVSQFDYWAYESLGQKTVIMNNLGAIASIGATRLSFSVPNQALMIRLVPNMLNEHYPVGYAMIDAKLRNTQSGINDDKYILMGDPNLSINPPISEDNLTLNDPSDKDEMIVHSRQSPIFSGSFAADNLQGEAQVLAFDAKRGAMINNYYVTHSGPQIFKGRVSVADSEFESSFYIPDDIEGGDTALVLSYFWDQATNQDYISYYYPLQLSADVLPDAPDNDSPPEISLFLGSYDFRSGDTVSTTPVLYAKVADENGINLTGYAGHNLLLVLDNSLNPITVTDYFEYDIDSYTSGTLQYQLTQLSEGPHNLQLIAFDNQNLPAVSETHFISRQTGAMSLENLLIYPNPMKDQGDITFIISDNAEITLDIFTMRGRRIRRIKTTAHQGFNQIPFDGRDEFGARLANNTYFIRLRAKTQDGNSIEKRERLVIYK
ncbi:MAG: hypothetical protein PWP64_416 [Candidatus Cloacimonadota bacterium]|nr:hypothetical protein [Candidatus Cloacimonadota bacterium]